MQIEHIAIWTEKLEGMKEFYVNYFHASVGKRYQNTAKQFESYFLSFSSGARLELMSRQGVAESTHQMGEATIGYAHISFACGSEKDVDQLTERLRSDGFRVMDHPRHTGDGYYESLVLDPDGNQVEITI
jgi:lactoylglutathione lyase